MQTQLTIQLPEDEANFIEEYTQKHNITISELFDNYIKQLQKIEEYSYHPDIKSITGIIPNDVSAKKEHHHYVERKNQ
jgi:hypothetical protein